MLSPLSCHNMPEKYTIMVEDHHIFKNKVYVVMMIDPELFKKVVKFLEEEENKDTGDNNTGTTSKPTTYETKTQALE